VPWALLAGYGYVGEWGLSAAATRVTVDDFVLDVTGVALSVSNRVELSVARQSLDVQPLGLKIRQDIWGGKLRLAGDLVYGKLPAITAGLQWKRNSDSAVPEALGARDDEGVDYTLSASRLWLDAIAGRNVFANMTLRHTRANQIGLLGFGGPQGRNGELVAAGSEGDFLNLYWVLGAEDCPKPNQFTALHEDPCGAPFLAWLPPKRLSAVSLLIIHH